MILVTGASGQTGSRVLRVLVARGVRVRGMVGREASRAGVLAAGATQAVAARFDDPAALDGAVAGATALYHVCPPMSDREVETGAALIEAATRHGVRKFVFHSLVHSQVDALAHHRDKRVVEGMLRESSLDYTILQPAMYMQNLAMEWERVRAEGVFAQPYSPDVRMSLVDLDDVAEAAAVVLTQPGWGGGCFELCGPDSLTRREMAQCLSEVLGHPVRAERGDRQAWIERARKLGTRSEFQIQRVLAMFDHYDRCGLSGGNPRVLELILGRRPRGYREFAERFVRQQSANPHRTPGTKETP
jgi:uncharacterized protein YbjT (DUF2867 family)